MNNIKSIFNELKKSIIYKLLLISIILLVITLTILFFMKNRFFEKKYISNVVRVFIQNNCNPCEDIEKYITENYKKYPNVDIRIYNISSSDLEKKIFFDYISKYNIPNNKLKTPLILTNNIYITDFNKKKEKIFKKLLQKINKN